MDLQLSEAIIRHKNAQFDFTVANIGFAVVIIFYLFIYYLYQTTKIHNSERNYNYN